MGKEDALMITVTKVNKKGNRIQGYTCTDGNRTIDVSKEQLCQLIEQGKVSNAKIQIYNAATIIRVSNAIVCNMNDKQEKHVDMHAYRGLTE